MNPTAQIMLHLSLQVPEVQESRRREMEDKWSLSTSGVGHTETAHFTLTPSRCIPSLFYLSLNHRLLVLLTITLPKLILILYKQEVLTIYFQTLFFSSQWPCTGDGVLSWVV